MPKSANAVRFSRTRARRGRPRGQMKTLAGPPASQQAYNGPYRVPKHMNQASTIVVELTVPATAVTSGAGLLANTIGMNPSGFTDWTASYKNVYDEYRVLASTMEYVPNYNNTFNSALAQAPFILGTDRDSNSVPANYGAAINYESAIVGNTGTRTTIHAKMTGSEDAGFSTTATTPVPWYHWYFGTGLTATTVYGMFFIRILVQFRARV